MNEQFEVQENQIRQITASFQYPPTPNIAAEVRDRLQTANGRQPSSAMRLAWAILLVLILAAGLLLVPQVRAAVMRIFNIGAITILELDESDQLIGETAGLTASKPSPLVQSGLVEEISFTEAAARFSSLYLPTYPNDLAEPDHTYLYESDSGWPPAIVFLWRAEQLGSETDLILYQILAREFATKGATILEETAVNGQRAMWLEMPHPFMLHENGRWQEWQFVEGNVLIWWHEDGLTFRLEGASSFEEAVQIAESLEKMEK